MKNSNIQKRFASLRGIAAALFALGALCSSQAQAQVPARFYWKTLSDGAAVPLIVQSISGNTNPFDSSHLVTPDASIDATVALAGYAQTFSLMDRSAMVAILQPMGRLSGEAGTSLGTTAKQSSRGFGDPMLEFDLNIIGPKAQKNIPDALSYEPGFSLDLLADLAMPVGEYNNKQELNLGQNRWYGRVGAPMIMQFGSWVPGRRTTLELLPAVWIFGENDDFVGKKLKTDPLFQLDVHLTRDFTENIWGSVDGFWYKGGKATIDGVSGDERNDKSFGLTLGYKINDNLSLTAGYKSTFNDSAAGAMQMDTFMVSLLFGWHPMIEGMGRLKSEK
jgi:hypothetical protein